MQCLNYRDLLITEQGRRDLEEELAAHRKLLRTRVASCPTIDARECGKSSGHRIPDTNDQEIASGNSRISKVSRILKEATIVPLPKQNDLLQIGLVAVLEHDPYGHSNESRVQQRLHVVGFEEGNCDSVPRKVSYDAPIICQFVGQEIGTTALIRIGNAMCEATLVSIEFPE